MPAPEDGAHGILRRHREPMNIQIWHENAGALAFYEEVPSALEVSEVFEIDAPNQEFDGLHLAWRALRRSASRIRGGVARRPRR